MAIKPIETRYKGYRFRSRLEARWAVFFDTAGIKWEYEPEGFELPSGRKYLPDFRIHGVTQRGPKDIWVEVKGQMTEADAEKILEFSVSNPILVVGNIPKGSTWRELADDMLQRSECYESLDRLFFNFETIDGDWFGLAAMPNGNGGLALCGADSNYMTGFDEELTVRAYATARQARFEHGEHGL